MESIDRAAAIAARYVPIFEREINAGFRNAVTTRTGKNVKFKGRVKNFIGAPDEIVVRTKRAAFILNHGLVAGTRVQEKSGRSREYTRKSSFIRAVGFIGRAIEKPTETLASELGENYADLASNVPSFKV